MWQVRYAPKPECGKLCLVLRTTTSSRASLNMVACILKAGGRVRCKNKIKRVT